MLQRGAAPAAAGKEGSPSSGGAGASAPPCEAQGTSGGLQQEASEASSSSSCSGADLAGEGSGCPLPGALSEDSSSFVIPAGRPEQQGEEEIEERPGPSSGSGGTGTGSGRLAAGPPAKGGPQQLLPPKAAGCEAVGLPPALQGFLDAAFRSQAHVVYVGLGSMLGTVFSPEQVGGWLGAWAGSNSSLRPLCG